MVRRNINSFCCIDSRSLISQTSQLVSRVMVQAVLRGMRGEGVSAGSMKASPRVTFEDGMLCRNIKILSSPSPHEPCGRCYFLLSRE
jgi:hypothetical protein